MARVDQGRIAMLRNACSAASNTGIGEPMRSVIDADRVFDWTAGSRPGVRYLSIPVTASANARGDGGSGGHFSGASSRPRPLAGGTAVPLLCDEELLHQGRELVPPRVGGKGDCPHFDGSKREQDHQSASNATKTLTGMTVVQVLFQKGLSMNDSVEPYLPGSWVRGDGIQQLTFRDLMTHTSGLDRNQNRGVDYASLQRDIEEGIEANDRHYVYQNANFALRVVLPYLHYGAAYMNDLENRGFNLELLTSALYKQIVRDRVLSKAGVDGDCRPIGDPAAETLTYAWVPSPFFGGPGLSWGDWTLLCGGGGWHFSARELATILATLRHTNLILTPAAKDTMDMSRLGWKEYPGLLGTYLGRDGLLISSDTPARGLNTCWLELPNGVEAALVVNSLPSHACGVIHDAFEDALVPRPETPPVGWRGGQP